MIDTKVSIGIIGCGMVSGEYLKILSQFPILDVVACADLDPTRARSRAAQYHIPRVCSTDEMLADPEISLVINLTTPGAHARLGLAAVQAGKSLYSEKPLTIKRDEACSLLRTASAQGVLVGSAPDTFLGSPLQTCRKLIDEGWIGRPIAAAACLMTHGPEDWHPNPAFYYQPGGGPMFDMGPYYLTALISLLGPVCKVMGATQTTYSEREITSQPHNGSKIAVQIPTHIAGIMHFASGVIGTITTSFEIWATETPALEIYGTEGTLSIPNPSFFAGPIRLRRAHSREWSTVSLIDHNYIDGRGLGIVDMAYALRDRRLHRANGELAYHVLDIMHAFHDAALEECSIEISSTCTRPAPLELEEFV